MVDWPLSYNDKEVCFVMKETWKKMDLMKENREHHINYFNHYPKS